VRPRHGAFGPTLRQLPCVGPSVLDGCFGSLYHGRTRTSSLGTGTRLCTWYGRARSGEVVLCYNIVCYVVRALASALGTAAPMRESGGTGADAFIDASWPLYMHRTRCSPYPKSALASTPRILSARLGSARLGSARLGSARLGSARLGSARLGSARLVGSGRRPRHSPPALVRLRCCCCSACCNVFGSAGGYRGPCGDGSAAHRCGRVLRLHHMTWYPTRHDTVSHAA
jgi:hypothetical protein